jgi:hypothetical protein
MMLYKKTIRNAIILLFPFLVMVLINEAVRPKIKEQPYTAHGITTMNSAKYLPKKCSWACYNNTSYCKTHHVKYLQSYYTITDVFYFGLIDLLQSTGNYGAANLIFLVFLFPLTILYFFIKSLDIQEKIQKLKKQKL